jgi:alkane 1-monooxygenase
MRIHAFKYFSPLIVFAAAGLAFYGHGIICLAPVFFGYVFIPIVEMLVSPKAANLSAAEEAMAKEDQVFDWALYIMVFIQVVFVLIFIKSLQQPNLSNLDIAFRTLSMGFLCGVFGINVGHELGHRNDSASQSLAKIALLTSLYVHFFIEHNKGHHKNVATPNDPSSARYRENIYSFFVRTISQSYLSAWHIANEEAAKTSKKWSMDNEMIIAHIMQGLWLCLIGFLFGWKILLIYMAAALIGILHLETVNYIEHYGLSRKATGENRYERAMPEHSWNSSHVMGRIMLFELSRHSDHHYMASRKYQILRHHDTAPQLPTGYPGSMLLSLVPPLWFKVMDKQMKKYGIEPVQVK